MRVFLDNAEYICRGGSLVNHLDTTICKDSFVRLICSMYFYRHKDFFRHKTISHVHTTMTKFSDSLESKQFLQWVGLPSDHQMKTLVDWYEFIQQVTYRVSKVTRYYEAKLLPSYGAITKHWLRANYVVKLAYSIREEGCSDLNNHTNYGWNDTESGIVIAWDEKSSTATHNQTKRTQCRCKKSGCTGRCSCFLSCLPCSAKCTCIDCQNPHNVDSNCGKCAQSASTTATTTTPGVSKDHRPSANANTNHEPTMDEVEEGQNDSTDFEEDDTEEGEDEQDNDDEEEAGYEENAEFQYDDGVVMLLHVSVEDMNSDHYGSDFEDSDIL